MQFINQDGSYDLTAIMVFAHATAKRLASEYKAFQLRQSVKHVNLHAMNVPYNVHFRDGLNKAWDYARVSKRKVAA